MRYFLLLLLVCAALSAEAQTITVPDANFRNFLATTYVGTTVSGNTVTFTTPSAASITSMNCSSRSIADLTGIAAFTGLTLLNCNNNQLTSLDVSTNTALTNLQCQNNQLTSLTLPASTALNQLFCFNNQLTSLDVSTNTALTRLDCFDNQLTSLNVSANTALTQLRCFNNQLTSLNVSTNTALQILFCYTNQLTSLDVSTNTALTNLQCYNNQLTNLNVSANTALLSLNCGNNQLTSMDVSANTVLNDLRCQNNRIPIILFDGSLSFILKDGITQVAVFRSASGTPSVPAAQTGGFVLGTTGAIVNLFTNTGPAGSLSSSTGTNPTIVGSLPSGIVRLSPDKFWTVSATSLTGITYSLILDLTGISGITNFTTLKVLKRDNSSSLWEDVSQPPISATVEYLEPFILVSGLTSFSDFGIGSIGDNPLPVELNSFTGVSTTRGVELAWSVASEQDNAGFIVFRDGQQIAHYNSTPELRGRGTTSEGKTYRYTDAFGLEVGKSYTYTLRSVDFDGTIHNINRTAVVQVTEAPKVVFAYKLEQNYPNPFNPSTKITFSIKEAGLVSLKVYDLLGREVATLVNERRSAGIYDVNFNAGALGSGVYFYTLTSSGFSQTKKMMLVK